MTTATTQGSVTFDAAGGPALLDVQSILLRFGGVTAVNGLSFQVHAGEILSVIGPNGAGKTSAFNCISGFYRPTSGSILFDGHPIKRLRPARIAALGMSRTFQNLRLFDDLTVEENVKAGLHTQVKQWFVDALLHTPRFRRSERRCAEESARWLEFVGLPDRGHRLVKELPYGEQRLVEIARALATSPKLLLLDEPGAGLNHSEKLQLLDLVRRIRSLGIAVVLIEHDMGFVMKVSDRIVVLNFGKEIAQGPPEAVQRDPAVIEAYLGTDDEDDVRAAEDATDGNA